MADDPPKKEVPAESLLPPAPSTTRGAIRIENTISRERYAQLSGSEPPQLCAATTEAEEAAKSRLYADKSDRWLYLAAKGKLELQLLLEIRRYERIGSRKGYAVCGLKKTDIELAEFFNAARPSVCKARKALKSRHLIDSVDGILQLRYAAILDTAKSMGWND